MQKIQEIEYSITDYYLVKLHNFNLNMNYN